MPTINLVARQPAKLATPDVSLFLAYMTGKSKHGSYGQTFRACVALLTTHTEPTFEYMHFICHLYDLYTDIHI
jgi:hypothetical protein